MVFFRKNKFILGIICFLMIVGTQSCTQRLYRPGYYFSFSDVERETKTESHRNVDDVVKTDDHSDVIANYNEAVSLNEDTIVGVAAKQEIADTVEQAIAIQSEEKNETQQTLTQVVPQPKPEYGTSDDLRLALYAILVAVLTFLLISLLFDLLPSFIPLVIAIIGGLAVLYFAFLSLRCHIKRNRLRKERGEATTHLEFGRHILEVLLVLLSLCVVGFTLLLSVFLTVF